MSMIMITTLLYNMWIAFNTKESAILVQVALRSRWLSGRQGASQSVQSLSLGQVSGSWHEQGRSVQQLLRSPLHAEAKMCI